MGCSIEQGVLEGATEALLAAAEERTNRVGGVTLFVTGRLCVTTIV